MTTSTTETPIVTTLMVTTSGADTTVTTATTSTNITPATTTVETSITLATTTALKSVKLVFKSLRETDTTDLSNSASMAFRTRASLITTEVGTSTFQQMGVIRTQTCLEGRKQANQPEGNNTIKMK